MARRTRVEGWSGTVVGAMVPEKFTNKVRKVCRSKTSPPVIVPPLKPTSDLGMVVVKFKTTSSPDVLLSVKSDHPPNKGADTATLLKSASPGNVMSALLTVPFVTSTASVPPKVYRVAC